MNEIQEYTNRWLSRMDDCDNEVKMLYIRRENIIASLSGIGKYNSEEIRGGSDANITESKNIEYAMISQKIENLERNISKENARTLEVIEKVDNAKLRGMLIGRYINRFSWRKVGHLFNYSKSSAYRYMLDCLDAVSEFIPKELISDENKFKSLKDWTGSD